MITEFYVTAEVDNDATFTVYPGASAGGFKALSVVDLAVLSTLLRETTASVDKALAVAKSVRSEAEAEQRLRERGILK